MPSNADFKLEILVADTPVPEYSKDGEHYVECNLSTPVSYMHQQCDTINGEKEMQSWPVTPYRIRIRASSMTSAEYPKYFRVLVDGVKVKGISLDPSESKVIKGFRDGSCIREFLFSMPRFAKDTTDRIETHRRAAVGKIVVECWDAVLRRSKWSLRSKYLDFQQANKKDSSQVTEGKYTMATSCPGKVVSGRAIHRLVDSWKLQTLRSTITLSYHMGHTLREMGFTLQSLDIPDENIRQAQRQREERSGDSESKVNETAVKKEPTDLPTLPQQSGPEIIDLTEDNEMVPIAQNAAMDLCVRSEEIEEKTDINHASESERVSVIEQSAMVTDGVSGSKASEIVVDDTGDNCGVIETVVNQEEVVITDEDKVKIGAEGTAKDDDSSKNEMQEVMEVEEMLVEHAEEIVQTETAMEEAEVASGEAGSDIDISTSNDKPTPGEQTDIDVLEKDGETNTVEESENETGVCDGNERKPSETDTGDKTVADIETEQNSKDETQEATEVHSGESASVVSENRDIVESTAENVKEGTEGEQSVQNINTMDKTVALDNQSESSKPDHTTESSNIDNEPQEENVSLKTDTSREDLTRDSDFVDAEEENLNITVTVKDSKDPKSERQRGEKEDQEEPSV